MDSKVALVTGTSGVAATTCARLVELGARVLACGIDEAANATLRNRTPGIVVRRADMAESADVEACLAEAVDRFGGIDVIINAAATSIPSARWSTPMPRPGHGAWRLVSARST